MLLQKEIMVNLSAVTKRRRTTQFFSAVLIIFGCLYLLIADEGLRTPLSRKRRKQNRSMTSNFNTRPTLSSTCLGGMKLLRGQMRIKKGLLTLGLCTVPRENISYFPETIESLISRMNEEEKRICVIVIFLASYDETWVNNTLKTIDQKHQESLASGLLQVIQPDNSIYPNFTTITKRNFNDKIERVHWRTKQNIDFANLFGYCEKLSEYYIHLEDDISAATDYIKDINDFVDKNKYVKWFILEFSHLGFIGKLFKSSDLCMLKKYLLLFKEEKPCDLLLNDLKGMLLQSKRIESRTSLFQHTGLTSSLKGKLQKLRDRAFKDELSLRKNKH